MRANPRKPECVFIGLTVNQNYIRLDVAVAESFVGSCKRVIAIFDWQRYIVDQKL
jgi:hypothetical protein